LSSAQATCARIGSYVRKPALHLSDIVRKSLWAGISERAAICSTVLSGQAPKPLGGTPKARGLTAKARIERSWMLPRMQIGSDIVRKIEYQILQPRLCRNAAEKLRMKHVLPAAVTNCYIIDTALTSDVG
jgi:hypothetical protein